MIDCVVLDKVDFCIDCCAKIVCEIFNQAVLKLLTWWVERLKTLNSQLRSAVQFYAIKAAKLKNFIEFLQSTQAWILYEKYIIFPMI